MIIYAPLMPDRLAVEAGLAPFSSVENRQHRDALVSLGMLNELRRGDIYVRCGFVDDQIVIASMVRWQPHLTIQSVDDFIRESREAIEFLRNKYRGAAA